MSKSSKKPKVGQILYSLNVGSAARNCDPKLTPVKVIKVGRKYFYCSKEGFQHFTPDKYHISTWDECSDCGPFSELYANEQAYKDKVESLKIYKIVSESFRYGGLSKPLSLKQLKAIEQIINEK